MDFVFAILFWGIILGSLIYFALRRARIRKEETFEEREN